MRFVTGTTDQVDEALKYLERAVQFGYKDLNRFRTDADLPREFREHSKVRALVGRRG